MIKLKYWMNGPAVYGHGRDWPGVTTEFSTKERILAWKQSENLNTPGKIDSGRSVGLGDAKGDDGGWGECR